MRKTIVDETEGMRAVFSERLRKTYKSMGLSQEDVAHRLSVPVATFRSWTNGARMPQPEVLYKMREVLGVTVDWLLGGPDDYMAALNIPAILERVCNEVMSAVLDSLSLMWGGELPNMARLQAGACTACVGLWRLYAGPHTDAMSMLRKHQQALEEVRKSLK